MGKVVHIKELAKKFGKSKVVLAGGAFDILHTGHLRYLTQAKKHGDVLLVCVKSDKEVRQRKGPNRPINKERDRARLIAELNSVDFAFISSKPTRHHEVLNIVKPNFLVISEGREKKKTWAFWKKKIQKQFPGTKVVFLPAPAHRISTSILIKKILRIRR